MIKETFGWVVIVNGLNDDYVAAYCHYRTDAEKIVEGFEHWQSIMKIDEACTHMSMTREEIINYLFEGETK